jgi:hypothetical protein
MRDIVSIVQPKKLAEEISCFIGKTPNTPYLFAAIGATPDTRSLA